MKKSLNTVQIFHKTEILQVGLVQFFSLTKTGLKRKLLKIMDNAFSILVLDFKPQSILGKEDADSKITLPYCTVYSTLC